MRSRIFAISPDARPRKNGRNVKRLTDELGYDGGPFWSYDGKQIVFRAYHPKTDAEKPDYMSLLKDDMIRPSKLDLYVMNADGSNKRRVFRIMQTDTGY